MHPGTLEFETIHETFRPKIRRYLARLVGEAEAEDLTQEVFVKVNQALQAFRGECELSTWIYRIATNVAIDKMRTTSFRYAPQIASLDQSEELVDRAAQTAAESPSLEQWLMRKEMYECFGDFLSALPANYRTVVVLSDVEGLINNEIAEILGLSLDIVKIRLHRGRARLLRELKTHCKREDWL